MSDDIDTMGETELASRFYIEVLREAGPPLLDGNAIMRGVRAMAERGWRWVGECPSMFGATAKFQRAGLNEDATVWTEEHHANDAGRRLEIATARAALKAIRAEEERCR